MKIKNTFFKLLDKLENVKISPIWGYSLATCLILFSVILTAFQLSVTYGDGVFINISFYWFYVLNCVAIALLALTKKTKRYGMKISRMFAITFVFIMCHVWDIFHCQAQMFISGYINSMMVIIMLSVVAGVAGYAFGKYVAKKIENCNMASVKIESSQG